MPSLEIYWVASLLGLAGSVTAIVKIAVRRYRRSVGRDLQPFSTYVLGSIKLYVGRKFSPLLARQFGVRQYAARSLAAFPDHLLVPSVTRFTLKLDHAYVHLSLSGAPQARIPDLSLLSQDFGSVLVFGEPGSGKSSLTKKLYREVCKDAYLRPFSSRLPVHVELRQVRWTSLPDDDREAERWFMSVLRDAVSTVEGVYDPKFVFEAFKGGPGLIIFLDGLDEIPAGKLPEALAAIRSVIGTIRRASAGSTVVVTARTQLRPTLPRSFHDTFGQVLLVDPFSATDVFVFLRRWPFSANRLTEAQRIFSQLRANPTLFDMCTNPLILSMYVAQDQRYAEAGALTRLPDTRPDFYREVIGELLFFRRQEQLGPAVAGAQVRKVRERVLGKIAIDHLVESDEPANSISYKRALAIVQEELHLEPDQAATELTRLGIETGIFGEERSGESLRFIHLTLGEFLAAMELSELDSSYLAQVLAAASERSAGEIGERRLWEVIIFALALVGRAQREAALAQMVGERAPCELLLRVIRESQAYGLPGSSAIIERAGEEIATTPIELWSDEWFAQTRLLLSCLADAKRLTAVQHRLMALPTDVQWLHDVVRQDPARLDKLFDHYLTASPAEALRVAEEYGTRGTLFSDRTRMLRAMEHPDFVALSLSIVQHDPEKNLDWIVLLAEAALKYELVASTLSDEALPASLREMADKVPRKHAWHVAGPLRGKCYGGLMAVATWASTVAVPNQSSDFNPLTRVEMVSKILPSDVWPAGRQVLRNAVFKVGPPVPGSSLLQTAVIVAISSDLVGVLAPPDCAAWAKMVEVTLQPGFRGWFYGTMVIGLKPRAGLKPPQRLRMLHTKPALVQIALVADLVDNHCWFPKRPFPHIT